MTWWSFIHLHMKNRGELCKVRIYIQHVEIRTFPSGSIVHDNDTKSSFPNSTSLISHCTIPSRHRVGSRKIRIFDMTREIRTFQKWMDTNRAIHVPHLFAASLRGSHTKALVENRILFLLIKSFIDQWSVPHSLVMKYMHQPPKRKMGSKKYKFPACYL